MGAAKTKETVSMRTNGVWLYVPDTNTPVEEITQRTSVNRLEHVNLERDADR